jgi:hypothetical protein
MASAFLANKMAVKDWPGSSAAGGVVVIAGALLLPALECNTYAKRAIQRVR